MAYPTASQLVVASGVPELTGASDSDVLSLRTAAIAAVEEFTGQSFDSEEATLSVPVGGSVAFLPRRLARLDTIAGAGGLSASDVALDGRGDRIVLRDWRWTSNAYERALREVSGELSPELGRALSITGLWGWEDCPDAVADAIRCDMEDQARADANDLSPTVAAMRALGVRDVSQGNLRLNIGEASMLSPRAVRLLTGYVWHGAGGELV